MVIFFFLFTLSSQIPIFFNPSVSSEVALLYFRRKVTKIRDLFHPKLLNHSWPKNFPVCLHIVCLVFMLFW